MNLFFGAPKIITIDQGLNSESEQFSKEWSSTQDSIWFEQGDKILYGLGKGILYGLSQYFQEFSLADFPAN